MKTIGRQLLCVAIAAGVWAPAGFGASQAEQVEAQSSRESTPTADQPSRAGASVSPSEANGTNGIRLNFRGAALDLVLEYLSDAAGFIINKEADAKGTIDMWSKDPVTPAQAAELLNLALKRNGLAAVRSGRILTVVSSDSAKTADLEIVTGNDPQRVEKSGEVVTQIIPVRHANAAQVVNNLSPLLPLNATLTVNESANSLILVASKTDIRRMLRIISALDDTIATVSSIKVYPLKHAEAQQLATVIQQLFTPQTSGQRSGGMNQRGQMFNFGGPPGMGGPGMGDSFAMGGPPAAGGSPSSGATGAVQGSQVVAVADEVSNSLIVSASQGLLASISTIVEQVDRPVSDITELRVFRLRHADPEELAESLTELFPDQSRQSSGVNQASVVFGGPPGSGPGAASDQPSGSSRSKQQSRVIAVADARTSSLLVSAPSTLMPQITRMIEDLDSSSARKEVVKTFDLQNANPNVISQVLQDLFQRNGTARNNNSSRSTSSEDNALQNRQTQQQQTGGNAGFGAGGFGGQRSGGGTGQ